MHCHYIVWVSIDGESVGLPLKTYTTLSPVKLDAIGQAIAAGAGLMYLYCTEAE